jgi:hypothetical protein
MSMLIRSFLKRESTLINVLKALVSITKMCILPIIVKECTHVFYAINK